MATVYLGLGSNIDPEDNLRFAIGELHRTYGELRLSNVYRNAAVGFEGADFLNLAVGLESNDSPADIHETIEAIHDRVGRQRDDDKYSSRPLDIDLLLYDDLVTAGPPVRLPRRDVLEYSFALLPLYELAPDYVHPETGRTLAEHWQECDAGRHPMTRVHVNLQTVATENP